MMSLLKYMALTALCILTACGGRQIPPPTRGTEPLPKDADISKFPPGKYGGILVDSNPGEPATFNPLVCEDASSSAMIGLLTSGLTSYDPVEEKIIPGLAKSWDIAPDNKTFTFHLREGLKWSDGAPLSADDIIFTFQCYYDKRFPTRKAYDLSVNGKPFEVSKLDDLTVQIKTPDIFAPFLLFIGGAEILPKHKLETSYKDGTLLKQWTRFTAQKNPQDLVSTGMFRIHSYRSGERIVFEPNPHYYRADSQGQRLPYINYYVINFVKDANATTAAFASGLTDSETISPDNVAWVKKGEPTYHYKIYDRGPSTSSSFIWFNQHPGKDKNGKPFVEPYKLKWFSNPKFRQAISYGIDRKGIVNGVLFGRGAPLWGPESPTNRKWFNPNVQQYPHDPQKALALLQEIGFTKKADGLLYDRDGHKLELLLATNAENPIRKNMATIFQENMRELGITVKLQFLDFATFIGKMQDSYDYEGAMLGLTGGGDPAGGMSIYPSKGRMHMWHPNQETPATPWEARIDELMTKQLKTLDESKRKEYYYEVQQIMSEQVPFIYLVTPNSYQGVKNRWNNVEIPPTGSVLWNADTIWTLTP